MSLRPGIRPMSDDYHLVRVKRDWVPERVWRWFCWSNLATWEPFRSILTRGPRHFGEQP